MAEQVTYLTAEGKKKLQDELEELKNVKRPEIAARLRHAIEQGDISENADYSSAKEDQGFMEGRIQELEKDSGKETTNYMATLENKLGSGNGSESSISGTGAAYQFS